MMERNKLTNDRTVLLIAFHFPPMQGSSGLQRTLRFAQHLPDFGWRPIVLSIDERAYEKTARIRGNELPSDLQVHRAFGLNAATQLSLFGRYPRFAALPDRWATWRYWAVAKALKLIRTERISAIWSTFPIATAHRIGLELARRSDLPWIAEFRDPMWQHDWPPEPVANRVWRQLEGEIVTAADRMVFVAPSAVTMYAERFPDVATNKYVLIENGYDEETFRKAQGSLPQQPSASTSSGHPSRPIVLLHSGIIYRSERDPTHFFAAIAALKSKGLISAAALQVILRASGEESDYGNDLKRLDIADIVRLESGIDYLAAIQEMLTVDGLLLLQAANCNAQVPAKLYEYVRANRPILALTDPIGDTAATLNKLGVGTIAKLDSTAEIEAALLSFIEQIAAGSWRRPTPEDVSRCSRHAQARALAGLLDEVVGGRAKPQ